jgi:hypothetical protein
MPEYSMLEVFGLTVDIASGLLFAGLGLWVLLVRPRRRLSIVFAAFAVAYGLSFVMLNLGPDYLQVLPPWTTFLLAGLDLAWAAALVAVAVLFPRRPTAAEAPRLWTGAVGAAAIAAVAVATLTSDPHPVGNFDGGLSGLPAMAYNVVDNLSYAAIAFFLLVTSLRATPGRRLRPCTPVALALVPYYGLLFGALCALSLREGAGLASAVGNFAFLAACPFIGILWLVRSERCGPADRRLARNVGLSCFVYPMAGSVLAVFLGQEIYTSGILGLTRILGVGILAYAILRQQLFDLDARLKWTIRRGAVAACFLGVFLVVEQVAQAAAGQAFGAVTGGVAAGLLLFALHPLRRLSDRIAERALPQVREEDPAYLAERKQEIYRNAYASAWEDGVLTASEMRFLEQVRDSLGLSPQVCARLEAAWGSGPKTP